jgi:cytochrome c2
VSAPNLTHFGTRNTIGAGLKDLTQESLEGWIIDPSSVKIGTRMQKHAAIYDTADGKVNLTPAEVSDIATYLLSLKPGTAPVGTVIETGGADGADIFATNCTSCHSTGDDTIVGPGLAGIGERAALRVAGMSAYDYLQQSLREPSAYVVDGFPAVMPEWSHLGDDSVDALIEYLTTLN